MSGETLGGRPGTGTKNEVRRKAAPISPLFSNLYMRRFVLGWKTLGHEKRLNAHIVNYADDFVICCRDTADQGHDFDAGDDGKAGADGERDRRRDPAGCRTNRSTSLGTPSVGAIRRRRASAYLGTRPSRKKVVAAVSRDQRNDRRRWTLLLAEDQEYPRLNRKLVGWANYFCLGPVSKAYRRGPINTSSSAPSVVVREAQGHRGQGTSRFPDEYLEQRLGLVRLQERTRNFPWANA